MLFYGKTDVGRRRAVNQDNFAVRKYCAEALLAVVCDGMGGANGGNVASALAIGAFVEMIDKCENENPGFYGMSEDDILDKLSEAADNANRIVYNESGKDEELEGMGTTLVACLVIYDTVYVINVGDSRLYMCGENGIRQISHDHSYVQYLVDIGKLTPDEARFAKNKNLITRAIGTEKTVASDLFTETAAHGDVIVLCSDGLTNHVDPEDIRDSVADIRTSADVQLACEKLIRSANENGGSDNITAVVISF